MAIESMDSISLFGGFWSVRILSEPANGKNQDAWAIGKNSAVVVDGATPLDSSWPQDVGEFANRISEVITEFADQTELPTSDVWRNSILKLRNEFSPSGYLRSAGVILLRKREEKLEISTLGDLYGAINCQNEYSLIHDNTLSNLDMKAKSINGQEILIKNRKLVNSPNGYWIFADDQEAANHIFVKSYRLQNVTELLISSDGYMRNRDIDSKTIFDDIRSSGLIAPRFHESNSLLDAPDDVTAIYLKNLDESGGDERI